MRFSLVLILAILAFQPFPAYCEGNDASSDSGTRTLDRVVARVNAEPITLLEVKSLLEINPELTYSNALDSLVDQRLVLSWARTNNITVSEEEIMRTERAIMLNNNIPEEGFDEALASRGQDREMFRDELKNQILVNKALNAALEAAMQIDEEEIKQRYEELYKPKRTFTIRHILIKAEPSSGLDEESARLLAEDIADRINGGTSFEDMALEYSSDNNSAANGGFLGTFREGELMPELEKLASSLKPGETGGPVQTSMGFHILRLDGESIEEPPPLPNVRDKIRADILSRREPDARKQWLQEIREKAFIEIFSDGG